MEFICFFKYRLSINKKYDIFIWVRWYIGIGKVSIVVYFEVGVDGVVISQFDYFFESIINKDEVNQRGEVFFSEASEVLN